MTGMARLGWHGSRKRPNGTYQARWQDAEGLQSLGGFIGKTQADAYALKMAGAALDVLAGLAVVRKPIREARDAFLDRRTKANTRALNERRVDEFLAAMPNIKDTSHLTSHVINQYARQLEDDGHNPGGQQHHLKIVRAFTNFCITSKWLTENPFAKFEMPSSEYEGRALTPDEFALMISLETVTNQNKEVDQWLNWAFRFGKATLLRISQVWKLTPADFTAPNMLKVAPIKDTDPETKPLNDEAIQILQEIPIRAPGSRYFSYWSSVEAMRNSVQDKARRVGLPGLRFHDVCKITGVTELSQQGFSLGDLAHLSNTSKATLDKHYIKSDRDRAYAKFLAFKKSGHTLATTGPQNEGFVAANGVQQAQEGSKGTIEIASTSQPIPSVRR
jgi:integrase